MKYLYILLAAFFSIQCFGQKIKKSEIDTFSGKANIETSIVPIKQRLTDGAGVFSNAEIVAIYYYLCRCTTKGML